MHCRRQFCRQRAVSVESGFVRVSMDQSLRYRNFANQIVLSFVKNADWTTKPETNRRRLHQMNKKVMQRSGNNLIKFWNKSAEISPKVFLIFLTIGLLSTPAMGYEVWLGTHRMEASVAINPDDWALTASLLEGLNINRSRDEVEPLSNAQWRSVFDQASSARPTVVGIARPEVSRDVSLVDDDLIPALDDHLDQRLRASRSFEYPVDFFMIYDERVDGVLQEWTDREIELMRERLDLLGGQDIGLIWRSTNNSQRFRRLAALPVFDHNMIEASANSLLNNTNNQITFLNYLLTNPATANKKAILQIPRSNNSMTQYAATRRVLINLGQELGYGEDGIRSDRLVILPVTYADNISYLPETVDDGTSYTNSLFSLALSLLEQRPLFEGRTRIPTNGDADSFVRSTSISQQSFGSLVAGWDTWENGANPNASVTASGVAASAVTTSEGSDWHVVDGRGASADGSWGTFDGSPTASTVGGNGVTNENLELSNATSGGTLTFTLTNTGTEDIDLDGFHFDAYAFRNKAARAYQLSVASGDLTNGVIYTSSDDEITTVDGAWDNNAHDDISHGLTDLPDHTLEAGGTVSFLLTFSSGVGDGSGGHDLWVDNVAVTATTAMVSQPTDGSLRLNKNNLAVDGEGLGFIINSGGLDIGQTGTAPYDRAAVMVFQLPNLGAIDAPFQSASFRAYVTQTVTSGNVGGDLYGIGRRETPEILNSDYYGLTNTPDPDAFLLENDFLVQNMAINASVLSSEMGNQSLVDFLNEQYAGGQGMGDYVFLRINVDQNTNQRWSIASGDASEGSQRPQITYQAISGPAFELGDFDGDGDVDLTDLDQYNGNIGATVTASLEPLDLDGDGIVGVNDFSVHYETLVETSNGQTGTFAGDVNLDGTVNVLGDAFTLIANLGGSANSWGQGDINGDGTVNVLGDAFALIANLGQSNN